MSSNRMSLNQREGLSAQSTITGKQEYLTSTGNILNVNATVSVSGGATSANQTNGTQKSQIVDGSGNVIGSTSNALDVNIKSGGGGGGSVTQGTSPWIVAGAGTAGSAASAVLTVQGIASMTKLLVTPDSVALPANQSVNVAQINGVTTTMGNGVAGTGVQRVAIASDNTAFSVNAVQSGTWNIGSITTLPALVAGSAVIGKVSIDQTTPGTTNLVALAANQSVNNAQINGITPLMGNGVTGTGSQRVTIASDNTAFSVNAVQSGTWNVATVTTLTGITNALPAGTNLMGKVGIDQTTVGTTNGVSLAQIGATTVVNGGVAGTLAVGGVTAAAASSTGNPVRTGAIGKTANPTAVTDGQVANMITDKLGKQVVVGSIRDLKANQVTTITSSVAETAIVTAVAATFLDLYGLIITNTSATAVNVAIKDATAGTTRLNIAVPAADTRGFMLPEGGAIKQAAVNGNWTATSSASVASLVITALTVQNL